jgi:hypothetical protein
MSVIGVPELLVVAGVLLVLCLPIWYLLTLQRALERCSVESRTLSPKKVWLLLIPLFNIVWQFFVVDHVSTSLHNEFKRRQIPGVRSFPGHAVGMAMCSLGALATILPYAGSPSGFNFALFLATIPLSIVYWVVIAHHSRMLRPSPASQQAAKAPDRGEHIGQAEKQVSKTDPNYAVCSACGFEQWTGYPTCQKCGATFAPERTHAVT